MVTSTIYYITHHEEESYALQSHVGIYVNKRITAKFYFAGLVLLYCKLVQTWTEIRCVILREVCGIGSQFYTKYLGYTELKIQIAENVPIR